MLIALRFGAPSRLFDLGAFDRIRRRSLRELVGEPLRLSTALSSASVMVGSRRSETSQASIIGAPVSGVIPLLASRTNPDQSPRIFPDLSRHVRASLRHEPTRAVF